MSLKQRLVDDMKTAMKSGNKATLGVIRLINAAIQQREIDAQIILDDTQIITVLDKMLKQCCDSVTQYEHANREDLAAIERAEIIVIERYLPIKLSESAIRVAIQAALIKTNASQPSDIGLLMGVLKTTLAGKADMGLVSKLVKQQLSHK